MLSMNLEFCERLVTTLAHSLWQGLFIGLIFALVTTLLRSRGPEIRHTISVTCLALLVACVPATFLLISPQETTKMEAASISPSRGPLVSELSPTDHPTEMNTTAVRVGPVVHETKNNRVQTWRTPWKRWIPWITSVYLMGVVIGLTRLGWGIWACHSLRQAATPLTDPEWLQRIELVRIRIGLRVAPAVFWCKKSLVPTVVGIIRPAILLPVTFATGLTVEQMEQILCHELMHIRRRDTLVNLLVRISEVLLFFHPVVWIISRRIRLERELCCDFASASSKDERWRYAQLLVELAERTQRQALATTQLAIASDPSELRIRIETLLRRPRARNGFVELRGFMLLTIVVLGLISFASPSLPIVRHLQAELRNAQPAKNRIPPRVDRVDEIKKQQELADIEREEQAQQIELSKNWPLRFPANVQDNELAGVIVDDQGKPVEGALVRFYPAMTGWETTTDAQGMFRYQFKDAGPNETYEVRFSKEGYSPIYRRKQLLGVKDFRVVLNNQTYLEGQVRDDQGKPVPNARVLANHQYHWDGNFNRETATMTDKDGNYRLYLHPELYTIAVVSNGQGVERVSDVKVLKNQGQKLDLQLHPGVHFQAKVLDADTNQPISGVVLYHRTEEWMRGTSNADGDLIIPHCLPGVESLEIGLGAGKWTKHGYFAFGTKPLGSWWSPEAHHEWHRSKPGTTEVGLSFEMKAGMPPITLYAQSGVLISGKVIDPDGNPVGKATVAAARPEESVFSLRPQVRNIRIKDFRAETKEDGTYEILLSASESEYNLMAHDGSRSQWRNFAQGVTAPMKTNSGQVIKNLDIQLHRPSVVRGKVVSEEGLRVGGLTVRARARDQRGNSHFDPTVKTKDDGTFEIGFIRPGEQYIQVEPMWEIPEDGPAESSALVELQEGETKNGIKLSYYSEAVGRTKLNKRNSRAANNDSPFVTIKFVDQAGSPVGGVRAGMGAMLVDYDEKTGGNWGFQYETESDAEGIVKYREGAMGFRQRPMIYARHAKRQLVGLADFTGQDQTNVFKVTMYPECHVSLKLTSSELEQRSKKLAGPEARIVFGKNQLLHYFAHRDSTIHALVPPGSYEIFCHVRNTAAPHTEQFTVVSGARTLDLGSADLPARRLELLEGKPAPELQEATDWKNSPPLKLSDLRGKIVLLDFWGWWCGPCLQDSMPKLFELQDEHRGKDLVIIGIHVPHGESDDVDTVGKLDARLASSREKFWQGKDITFPVALTAYHKAIHLEGGLLDASTKLCAEYGVQGFPTGVLIDREGNVIGEFNVRNTDDREWLRRILNAK